MKNVLKTIFALGITLAALFLAVNGLLNLLYSARDQEIFTSENAQQDFTARFIKEYKEAAKVTVPNIGELPLVGEYETFTIEEGGVRKSSKPPQEADIKIAVYGASQAFGFTLADEETLVSALNQASTRYAFVNYSVIGQSMGTNGNYIRYMFRQSQDADWVILLSNPTLDIINFCRQMRGSLESDKTLAIWRLFESLKRRITNEQQVVAGRATRYCGLTSYPEHALIPEVMLNLENTRQFLKNKGVKFRVFLLPTPYTGAPDISNIENRLRNRKGPIIGDIAPMMFDSLSQWPGLIDLRNAFDGYGPLFKDGEGHFSYEGSQILAQQILAKLDQLLEADESI